jgi:hypothetical protein
LLNSLISRMTTSEWVKKEVRNKYSFTFGLHSCFVCVPAHAECRYVGKLVGLSKPKNFKRRCRDLTRKIMQIHFRIKIHGFRRFHRRWLTIPKFSSPLRYTKLEWCKLQVIYSYLKLWDVLLCLMWTSIHEY